MLSVPSGRPNSAAVGVGRDTPFGLVPSTRLRPKWPEHNFDLKRSVVLLNKERCVT